ncbi:hypothetical protein [Methylocaldum sp.]|uniref:hypothetical protein n=1 Tax=Methylocaldum sp. TaxID=1969727 RepID=UPI002D4B35EF|nr:hypothetical protein [Methylocaldum sp.]HYE38263.1 hypothetical protein [Methylocaldum sp.]
MSEWIEHDGKGLPVAPETKVLVRLRGGTETGDPDRAGWWDDPDPTDSNWVANAGSPSCDIVAYRIVSPPHGESNGR